MIIPDKTILKNTLCIHNGGEIKPYVSIKE